MRVNLPVLHPVLLQKAFACLFVLIITSGGGGLHVLRAQIPESASAPNASDIQRLIERVRVGGFDPETAAVARSVAFNLLAASRYGDAWLIFNVLIDGGPGDQQSHYGGALALFNLGRVAPAEQLARVAIELAESHAAPPARGNGEPDIAAKKRVADSLVLLGVILAVKGDSGAALNSLRRAVQLSPDSFDAQFALGRAFYGAGDPANAVKAFRAAIALRPADRNSRFFLATSLEVAGDYDRARAAYLELVALSPESVEGHLGLGVLLAKLGRENAEECISELIKATALDGNLYEARVTLGRTLIRVGRPAEAVLHLTRAVEIAPNNPEPHYQLAIAYRRLGRLAEAQAESERVKAINAGHRVGSAHSNSRIELKEQE
jgi:Flp pilus assembly protein TadD